MSRTILFLPFNHYLIKGLPLSANREVEEGNWPEFGQGVLERNDLPPLEIITGLGGDFCFNAFHPSPATGCSDIRMA